MGKRDEAFEPDLQAVEKKDYVVDYHCCGAVRLADSRSWVGVWG